MSNALKDESNAAILEVARERTNVADYILANGARAVIQPVAPALIDGVTARIKNPEPPIFHNEEKGRDEPNYLDPSYTAELAEAERKRGQAAIDAIIMFGVELVDPVPEGMWYKKLQLLGVIDSDQAYDKLDEFEKQLIYLKYVAVSNKDIQQIMRLSGVRQEDIEAAEDSFRS